MISMVLNHEWHRNPFSNIEKTLRIPKLIKYALFIFFIRVVVIWLVFGIILFLLLKSLIFSTLIGFFTTLFFEMFVLKQHYFKSTLPRHTKNADKAKYQFDEIKNKKLTNIELVKYIEMFADYSAWGIINIGYLFIPSWGWEILIRLIYPLIVKTKDVPYQNLLIGFHNKTIEADEFLWQLSRESNGIKKAQMREEYIQKYGKNRVDDLDLKCPTLVENKKQLDTLIRLYEKTESPVARIETIMELRKQSMQTVLKNLRIPKVVFLIFIKIVQENVSLREDRRFHEFEFDYYIRQLLFKLADQNNISREVIFDSPWKELKYYAKNN